MGLLIGTQKIGTNPYAPPEASDVRMYTFNDCDHLTLGQLVNAVCCRIGMALEMQSVNKSNILTSETELIDAYSEVITGLSKGTITRYEYTLSSTGYAGMTLREFFKQQDVATDEEKEKLDTLSGRLLLLNRARLASEPATNTSQKDLVDLQTCISRRDVAYATATNSVRALGTALQGTAANF